jgi:transposase-like protein
MARRGYPAEFRRRVVDLVEGGRKVSEIAAARGVELDDWLVEAFVYEDKIDQSTHDEQRALLDREIEAVQEQIDAATPEELDLEGALDFAQGVLTDPAGCWEALAPELRPGFQQAVYPNGLTYRAGEFGTAETSWAFAYLHEEMRERKKWRPRIGKTSYEFPRSDNVVFW